VAERASGDLLFEVMTPLGFRVRLTRPSWNLLITVKHPTMAGREDDVKQALANPTDAIKEGMRVWPK
jgi:hypothetical protein